MKLIAVVSHEAVLLPVVAPVLVRQALLRAVVLLVLVQEDVQMILVQRIVAKKKLMNTMDRFVQGMWKLKKFGKQQGNVVMVQKSFVVQLTETIVDAQMEQIVFVRMDA